MIVRKANKSDFETIIDVANKTFIPKRDESFDFRTAVPRAYTSDNYASCHFLVEEENEIRALCGNIFDNIYVNDNSYLFSILGTVSTLPVYQGRGYMKALLKEVNNENINKNVVFSCLTGSRERYNYFGYEQIGYRYEFQFNDYFYTHNTINNHYDIKEASNLDLEKAYEMFIHKNGYIKRDFSQFVLRLKCSDSLIYSIKNNGKLIGYFNYSKRKNQITEFELNDLNSLCDVILEIGNITINHYFKIFVSPFESDKLKVFGKYAEETNTSSPIRLKVYNYQKFLEMVLGMNRNYLPNDAKEIVTIDNVNYLIEIKIKEYKVSLTNEKGREFSSMNFIYYAFRQFKDNSSNIFPLMFDIGNPDLF